MWQDAHCAAFVRVVAVGARHALRVHAALQERPPFVDLVALLAVGLVQAFREQRRPVVIEEGAPRVVAAGDLPTSRVALRAHLDLAGSRARAAARGDAGLRNGNPRHAAPLVEQHGEALPRILRGLRARFRPGGVIRARPVAGLAADVELRPLRVEGVLRAVVALHEIGGVAVGAHVVPVLLAAGPVQLVAGAQLLLRIEVEPALSALRLGARIPRDGEGLEAATRELEEVLL
jgi:hypothetical protein